MAPRRETPPLRDNRNSDGARNRQLLNAHTGAGVNASRPAAIRGRGGSSRSGGTSRRGALENQRGHQRRSPVSTPGRRMAERLNSDGNQRRRVQEVSSSSNNNNNAEPQAQHNRSEQRPAANLSTQERSVSNLTAPPSTLPHETVPHYSRTANSLLKAYFPHQRLYSRDASQTNSSSPAPLHHLQLLPSCVHRTKPHLPLRSLLLSFSSSLPCC